MFSELFLCVLCVFAGDRVDREVQPQKDPRILLKEVSDIAGYYTCKGVEAGGKKYSGIAVIAKKNDIYVVTWVIGGASTFAGVGIRQGDTLAVSWVMPVEKGFVRGVNLYKIEPGPRLVGTWATLPGPGVLQKETLTFLKNLEPDEE